MAAAPAAGQAPAAPADVAWVVAEPAANRFPLARAGRPVPLYVSPSDNAGVLRAAGDLRADLGRVTGAEPELRRDDRPAGNAVVLIGTRGASPLIDGLVAAGKLDAHAIDGRWESFVVRILDAPLPGVRRALVIAGSDRRGTIYGMYALSAQIGVSPWYWWADVPVARRADLFVLPGVHTRGEPAVKYRGIFLNDEAPALSGWAREKFGGFNHEFYGHVFELILRLGGNFLWPAMWGNAFYDDDSLNAKLASEYGVVMGTSHHEPMSRAQQEWRRYGSGAWNYETNDSTLRAFWREGIRRMDANESLVTIGMRGDGDMPMSDATNIALLEHIVADQRAIIRDVTGRDPATVPQVWALYKEVQDYYDRGMRVPEDVTLLFSDDNWGNLRRLPDTGAPQRPGGFGIYYHFDYVGGPRNYKWIDTNPIGRVQEQLHIGYELGVRQLWIVNVGDLKPMEFPISFFLDYAWAPDRWPPDRLAAYTRHWAAAQFGRGHAQDIAGIITRTLQYAARRKPELLGPETYSLVHYDEGARVLAGYDTLVAQARRVGAALGAQQRTAYYELVLHPVEAAANLNRLYVTVARNRLYARQGRAATNALAQQAKALFARDAEITAFYNDTLAGGKWRHMMDQTHIGYRSWQEPPRNSMPEVQEIELPDAADMGVAIEGADAWWPADTSAAVLPAIDRYGRQTRTIEVFDRGRSPFEYRARAAQPWVRLTPAQGSVSSETANIRVSVDWARVPSGQQRVPITITGASARPVQVLLVVDNPAQPVPDRVQGFVAGNGYVSMEAAHFTRAVTTAGMQWVRLPDLGRTLSGMTAYPVTAPRLLPGGASPRLEYQVYVFQPGDVQVHAYVSPTLDYNAPRGLLYAVAFDDEPPQTLDLAADTTQATWNRAVADNIRVLTSRHHLAAAGEHVLKFWLVDPGVVLQKLVVDLGGMRSSYLGPPESFRGPVR